MAFMTLNSRIDHTIAVCTTGDRESLSATLVALAKSIMPDKAAASEIIIVLSGAVEVSESLEALMAAIFQGSQVSTRLLCEGTPGVARARNVALSEATGDVLTFIDDDIRPCGPSWQEAILATFARRPDVGLVTGPIFFVEPPGVSRHAWWRSERTDACLTCASRGCSGPCSPWQVWTANASFRLSATAGLRFPEVLGWGAQGRYPLAGEDVWFSSSVAARGWIAWYVADAAVEHYVDADRLRPVWLLRRGITEGRTIAVLRAAEGADPAAEKRRAMVGCVRAVAWAVREALCLRGRNAFRACFNAAVLGGIVSFPLRHLAPVVDHLGRGDVAKDAEGGTI